MKIVGRVAETRLTDGGQAGSDYPGTARLGGGDPASDHLEASRPSGGDPASDHPGARRPAAGDAERGPSGFAARTGSFPAGGQRGNRNDGDTHDDPPRRRRRNIHRRAGPGFICACAIGFCCAAVMIGTEAAQAQTGAPIMLPEITVTTTPIVRRAPRQPEPASAPSGVASEAPTAADAPLPGTLPIVTDQFATVTVITAEELRRQNAGTLGDLLFAKPGITGSGFAPGAASRPVVRGLDQNRVRIQENGLGANGASTLGEDHVAPVDPLAATRIEVVRGPATLRWGSEAIGGVVNASNNRIPDAIPRDGFRAEFRGGYETGHNGKDGAVLIDGGKGNIAFHADAWGRRADDYAVPVSPYRFDTTQPFNGKQRNSALTSDGQSAGLSYIFDSGFAGVAIQQFNSIYHIPGIGSAAANTRLDVNQTKVTSRGEWRVGSPLIDAVRYWAGTTDYRHHERGLEDPADLTTDMIHQTFTNRETEGRLEMQLAPFSLRFAEMTTALGVQAGNQRLTAAGEEGGLFDPNRTRTLAGYAFNEFQFGNGLKAQLAGRVEEARVTGAAPDFLGGILESITRTNTYTPKSASFGVLQNLPGDLVASATAQYVERAPRAAELYSRGPHDATATFDIGNPNLDIEAAKTIEVGLRRAIGPLRFEATAYYTRFDGFIFRRLTGETCDATFDTCGAGGGTELNQAIYTQRDAVFRGGEFQFQWDVLPVWSGLFGVDGQYDIVRATFTDGTNVPRIPPQRVGGGLYWRDANWLARIGLIHALPQHDVAPNETETDGYNLLKAELSYTKKLKPSDYGMREVSFGISGNNLLDEQIRNAVSFTKDEVLMPGRSVRAFARVMF